ncbi:MAG TPA: hypothetical protein PK280_16650, partial [Planctomycetota bacterium]|nr:hypothetical protein [Planctomycetota bacterium]
GLMSQDTSKSVTQVPLLGDIPLLGHLFRHTKNDISKTHLVVVIKAQIIDPSGRGYADHAGPNGANGQVRKEQPSAGPWFVAEPLAPAGAR